jgi:hypothetical protein
MLAMTLTNGVSLSGAHDTSGELTEGLIQVSWCVGTTLVICLREGPITEGRFSEGFKDYCRGHGNNFAEVLPNATEIPNLFSRMPIHIDQIRSYFWFFSTDIVSPVRDQMMQIEATIEDTGADS